MKSIIIIKFFVIVMLTIFRNGTQAEETSDIMERMARNGETIDGILKPLANGSLGWGWFGATWKCQLIPCKNMEVAMKLLPAHSMDTSKVEYDAYYHLNAINNSDSLNFGIPTIHYYGTWKGYKLLAMTLLDSKYQQKIKDCNIKELDVFIACREFIKIIKYIHSRGIIHFDTKIGNMIVQNGHGFIYDFGLSMDMNEFSLKENIGYAKEDLKRFLYSLFPLIEPKSNWRWLGYGTKDANRMRHRLGFVDDLANDAKTNKGKKFSGLRRVFVEFAKHACDNDTTSVRDSKGTPFYDQLYQVICEEMKSNGSIASIPDPFGPVNRTRARVNYEFFMNKYSDRIRDARAKA